MTLPELIALLGIMLALAALPSASVLLVVTRSATAGLANGIAVAAGIVLGDLVFIALALLGLSLVAETLGGLFVVVRYLGALYLLWLGLSLLTRKRTAPARRQDTGTTGSLVASFLAGFFLTLGDIKAILFYASLFPLFIDLSTVRAADIVLVIAATVAAVGGVKVVYALLAKQIAGRARDMRFGDAARKTAGGLLVGAGGWLMAKS